MKRHILNLLITLALCFVTQSTYAETRSLVLVTNKNSEIEALTLKDTKKAYLGLLRNKSHIQAIHNHSDKLAHEVFLQHVIRMSSRYYERALTKRFMGSGAIRPKSFTSQEKLVTHISENNSNVAYIWKDQATKHPDLKIILVIWHGETHQ